jgi:hypothetical protein
MGSLSVSCKEKQHTMCCSRSHPVTTLQSCYINLQETTPTSKITTTSAAL